MVLAAPMKLVPKATRRPSFSEIVNAPHRRAERCIHAADDSGKYDLQRDDDARDSLRSEVHQVLPMDGAAEGGERRADAITRLTASLVLRLDIPVGMKQARHQLAPAVPTVGVQTTGNTARDFRNRACVPW